MEEVDVEGVGAAVGPVAILDREVRLCPALGQVRRNVDLNTRLLRQSGRLRVTA